MKAEDIKVGRTYRSKAGRLRTVRNIVERQVCYSDCMGVRLPPNERRFICEQAITWTDLRRFSEWAVEDVTESGEV